MRLFRRYNLISCTLSLFLFFFYLTSYVFAIKDPLVASNNKFGIHIASPTSDEASHAADLVNSSGGDWGYITVVIPSEDRDKPNNEGTDKWQQFFNELRHKHLIPIVRLATKPLDDHWQKPQEGDGQKWSDFLNKLVWPNKNRYVLVYNEPNQGQEWENQTDPVAYAKILDETITALKSRSDDFFVLNAGFDASAPSKPPNYYDEERFLTVMNQTVPGIFDKLDGWNSHSYPNPDYRGSPSAFGRGTVTTYVWETYLLSRMGIKKNLPVFITETGWKHSNGTNFDGSRPSPEKVGEYYKYAFENIWNDPKVVAVTPFVLNYQAPPFDQFSFKKVTGDQHSKQVLGTEFPDFLPQYYTLVSLPKTKGQPIQENKAQIIKGGIPKVLTSGEKYIFQLTLKNAGQSIWNEHSTDASPSGLVKLSAVEGKEKFSIEENALPQGRKIEPTSDHTFNVALYTPEAGSYKITLQLFSGDKAFDNSQFEFPVEVKPPVMVEINTSLKWKSNYSGGYTLANTSDFGEIQQKITLNEQGDSGKMVNKYLVPGKIYRFVLKRPFYLPKTIITKVENGENKLEFGEMEPDFGAVLLRPLDLIKLLPFIN